MDDEQKRRPGLGGRPDYSNITNLKSAKQKQEEKRQEIINSDLKKIDEVIESNDISVLIEVHRIIDSKYQSSFEDWGKGTYMYNDDFGFDYDGLEDTKDVDMLVHNLKFMRGKLEALRDGFVEIRKTSDKSVNVAVNNSNENHNENNIDINLTFEQAKQRLEDMPGLDQSATEELQGKVDELENISKDQSDLKKKKWEKVKPILKFAIDKGADIAIVFMELVLQMKLGL